MANSTIISDIKERLVDAMARNDTLFYAIDAPECENGGDLINTHIFKYNRNPNTVLQSITFITIMVFTQARDANKTFVTPTLEIWIYTHNDHMKMDSKVTKDNRNDYISMLLDTMINGSTEYGGIGRFVLVSNTEGSYNNEFLFRRMIFETVDVNNSLC